LKHNWQGMEIDKHSLTLTELIVHKQQTRLEHLWKITCKGFKDLVLLPSQLGELYKPIIL